MGSRGGLLPGLAAAAAATVAIASWASGLWGMPPSLDFVVPPMGRHPGSGGLLAEAGAGVLGRAGLPAGGRAGAARALSSAATLAALAAACLGLVTRAERRRATAAVQRPRVTMWARGQNFMRPNAKGTKPMIHRAICRDLLKDSMEGWIKKYRTAGDIEDIMKKTIYGRVQFQFASTNFSDDIPWFPVGGKAGAQNPVNDAEDHLYDDALYVRKYLEPAKFKKLEILNWEMPENFTKSVTLQELVAAGMQYGHASGVWNPKMLKYLYSEFEGTHIFDLVQTAACMNRACYYAMEAATRGATFLFTGTKEQAGRLIRQSAQRVSMHWCDTRFVGGLLTNHAQVKKGIDLMKKMRMQKEQGAWRIESDVQRMKNNLKIGRLIRKYEGVQNMKGLPDIMIVVDEVKERNAISEATRLGIPVIALIDSNSNPTFIDLPIPGNASGSRAIDLVLGKLTEAILRGQALGSAMQPGDQEPIEKEWDPWIFSKDRLRYMRRRSKRQEWHKALYGGYQQYKKANPFGNIKPCAPFEKFSWKA